MESKRVLYELGHWSEAYMAQRASEITNFFCWECKKEIHGISMYEHWSKCNPEFFINLNKHKGRRVGYVKQTGRSGFDPDGISPELQQGVLHAEPEEDRGALLEDSSREDVRKEPEPVFKIFRRLQDDFKDSKDP